MFKNPFSFKGRIRRLEYGLSLLISFTALLILGALSAGEPTNTVAIIILMVYVPILYFLIAQGAKRCHDRSSSFLHLDYGIWRK